jgi:hypothetical protein
VKGFGAGTGEQRHGAERIRVVFDHLDALTDRNGLFEHARHATPRAEHGYCVDDAARGLVVTCREPNPGPVVQRLHQQYLTFVLAAVRPDGRCHNRMDPGGRWSDEPGLGDWWGRALWGLGTAAARSPAAGQRARALAGFRLAAQRRSPDARASAFAALGAGELLRARPTEPAALDILGHILTTLGRHRPTGSWPWPEPRLAYANATLAEALMVAGAALADDAALARGLELLTFLMRVEVAGTHLSVTAVGGRGPGEPGPHFDQQPIEVAAIADACATAHRLTHDPAWLSGVDLATAWFLGRNDSMTVMFDPVTGAGYDGLEPTGRNRNQGAESTLALLSTAQHARQAAELR